MLRQQLESFQRVLIRDLTGEQFADMYAQTICYGLFAARCNTDKVSSFSRETAGFRLPRTNPFLRGIFSQIASSELNDRITWTVDTLASILQQTDMSGILSDFAKRSRREDPVVHFYETLTCCLMKMRHQFLNCTCRPPLFVVPIDADFMPVEHL